MVVGPTTQTLIYITTYVISGAQAMTPSPSLRTMDCMQVWVGWPMGYGPNPINNKRA